MEVSPLQWLHSLQITDSFFPLGAFSYSDGLETAASEGQVKSGEDLEAWMNTWTRDTFYNCEGPALIMIHQARKRDDWEKIRQIDIELTAIKPAKSCRESSHSLGRRLVKSSLPLFPDAALKEVERKIDQNTLHGNYITVLAIIFARMGLTLEPSLLNFVYSRHCGSISSALRLIPIGQREAQAILTRQIEIAATVIEELLCQEPVGIKSFTPAVDIAQMNHPYLYTRLFRS